jgi:DNA processing protein
MNGSRPERDAWAILASADGVGPIAFASLIRRFGSASAVLAAAASDGGRRLRHPPPDLDALGPDPLRDGRLVEPIIAAVDGAAKLLADIEASRSVILTLDDPAYPTRLRAVEDPPPVLYVRGATEALATERAVALVGTRRPTEQGRRVAARIAGAVAGAGATVVSGLAVGIDGVAHDAALRERAVTVGVLGSGQLRPYPLAHRGLARQIEQAGGAVVSELAPEVRPSRHTFPKRNRIISGLAEATVVVEAGIGSGALITARHALDQGRECFIVPGPMGAPEAAGALGFLREQAGLARIVAGVEELIDDLGLADAARAAMLAPSPADELGVTESLIARAICDGRGTLDALALETGLATATILGAVTRLELRGLVVESLGRYRPAGLLATRGARTTRQPRRVVFARPSRPVLP